MSKSYRLHDPKFPTSPVDVFLQNDGVILLEGDDGEQVALSQVELKQLVEWLERTRVEEEQQKANNELAAWNALSKPA